MARLTALPVFLAQLRLLDVGALTGTAYAAYPWLDVTSIDINPRAPHVIQSDFFDFEPPSGEEENPPYDVVSLSLVVNFIGDLHKRGEHEPRRGCALTYDEPPTDHHSSHPFCAAPPRQAPRSFVPTSSWGLKATSTSSCPSHASSRRAI